MRISSGLYFFTSIRYSIFAIIVVVLPDPAPAIIRALSVYLTAFN